MRLSLVFFFLAISFCSFGQTPRMQIKGTVKDTSAKNPLENAVVMAVRLNDSVLVGFTRTAKTGLFELNNIPIDTYQVVISHPQYADGIYILPGTKENYEFDFGKIILPTKTQQLGEVTVLGFRDKIYYKGDTLIYTADSFKVKPNATVEDLLKKLPGVKVDAKGKITTQGKTVEKVLVDGDEFFGGDPTVATRNLNASNIESVQVYDKKAEATADGTSEQETIKVMNLKLKEEAKKGYFGKASGASDFQKFYEGEILANKFNKNRKFSVYGLTGNTPRTNFNFGDIYKYGLDNEMNTFTNEDGMSYYYSSSEAEGLPRTLKSGIYYTDRLNKKTKLLSNYSYNQNLLKVNSETRDQYFLGDTTYTVNNSSFDNTFKDAHALNLELNVDIDTLTTLILRPKAVVSSNKADHLEDNSYVSENEVTTRKTTIANSTKSQSSDFSLGSSFKRKFKKKDRNLLINYNFDYSSTSGRGLLKTTNTIDTTLFSSNVNQEKTSSNENISNNITSSFTEPLTKKIKLEFMFDFMHNQGKQQKEAFNFFNGEYSQKDSLLSNSFQNRRITARPGFKFIYESKKNRFAIGTRARNVQVTNENKITQQIIKQDVTNVLPFLSYRYKFSENKNFNFAYYTSSGLPSINQLQPVYNNTNPNNIIVGNPNLAPSYSHRFESNFYSFKPISGFSFWSGFGVDYTNNAITSFTSFDSYGRTLTKSVNVNGNYDGNIWVGMSIPTFKKLLTISPSSNAGYSDNTNFINEQKNHTVTKYVNGSLELELSTEKITASIGGDYEYSSPTTTFNNEINIPYSTQRFNFEFEWQMPKKFTLSTDGIYTINSKRSDGYNINYFTWNASFGKKFFKKENLILALEANDILNQNISANRSVQSNVVTDSKTTIIKRYFLLRLTYKFNSNKAEEGGEDDF